MKRLNWGIIGCGDVTEKKSGPAFYTLPQTSLKAVMRRDEEKARDYARRHNVLVYYTNASDLIQDPNVDAVYIATPPESHARYAIEAMKAGKPVYVEKPMALDALQCNKMVQTSVQTGVPLFVAYYRRKLDYFLHVKDLIDKGVIGEVTLAEIRLWRAPLTDDDTQSKSWRLDPNTSGGGYFVDMGAHQIDLLLWFFGALNKVSGFATNRGGIYEAEDTVEAIFEFESGVLASGSWCFVATQEASRDVFEITGTKGRIIFSTFKMDEIRLITDSGEEIILLDKPEIIEMPMISYVSDQILGNEFDGRALSDAVRVTSIIDEILYNYRSRINSK